MGEAYGYLRSSAFFDKRLPAKLVEAHGHQRQLTSTLHEAFESADGNAQLLELLKKAQRDAEGVKDFLGALTKTTYYTEHVADSSNTVGHKVFDIPEILEAILCKVAGPKDLLAAQRVNRQFRDVIDGSLKLQRLLFLVAPGPTGPKSKNCPPFYFNNVGLHSRFTMLEDQQTHGDDNVVAGNITTERDGYGIDRFRPGPKCRRMLICYPPVKEMYGFTSCDRPSTASRPSATVRRTPQVTVQNVNGLTIGDLYDAADRLEDKHKDCLNAGWRHLNQDGTVQVRVSFQAKVLLSQDEPWVVAHRRREGAMKERIDASIAEKGLMRSYAQARRTALENGQKAPSVEEWRATRYVGDH